MLRGRIDQLEVQLNQMLGLNAKGRTMNDPAGSLDPARPGRRKRRLSAEARAKIAAAATARWAKQKAAGKNHL